MDALTLFARTQYANHEINMDLDQEFLEHPPLTLEDIRKQMQDAVFANKYHVMINEITPKDEQVLLLEGYEIEGHLGFITISWGTPRSIKPTIKYIKSKIQRRLEEPSLPWE